VTYDDVFIRRHSQQNVDLKACSVSMVITWCDHGHSAAGNATIVRFEPLEFTLNIARTASDGSHPWNVI
jgi:hypothetical protein